MEELNKDKVRGNYIMDIADITEKNLQKKTAAKADKEQPEKEVKNKNRGKWYVINYANALLNSGISGEARILADYIITNQGDDWKFYPYKVKEQTGLSEKKYYECLNELESVKAIHPRIKIRNGRKYEAGVKLIWNFNYQTWESKVKELSQKGNPQKGNPQKGNPQKGNPQKGNPQKGNPQKGLSQNGGSNNIDKTITSPPGNSEHETKKAISLNSEHGEKREGAAAKPQPAPALPEGAENVPEESAAQNTPGEAASPGSSNTETAQGQHNGNKYQLPLTVPEVIEPGQTDLFGALPKKPKNEIPTLEQVAAYITKYITEKKARDFWTVYEIRLTAEKILNNPKAKKWKDWRQGVRNWIMSGHKGAFRPEVVDPARFDKGNQPGQTFQQGQQELFYERIIGLVESGTATLEGVLEGFGITDPEDVRRIRNEIARRRGNSAAL